MTTFNLNFSCDYIKDKFDAYSLGKVIEEFVHDNYGIYSGFKIESVTPKIENEDRL